MDNVIQQWQRICFRHTQGHFSELVTSLALLCRVGTNDKNLPKISTYFSLGGVGLVIALKMDFCLPWRKRISNCFFSVKQNTLAEFLPSRLLVVFKSLVVNNQRFSGYSVQKSLDRPWIISMGKTWDPW